MSEAVTGTLGIVMYFIVVGIFIFITLKGMSDNE